MNNVHTGVTSKATYRAVRSIWLVALAAGVTLISCVAPTPPAAPPVAVPAVVIPTPRPPVKQPAITEARASWYGPGFAGRKTSTGERYNPNAMTAASKTLPIGSVVKVTNPTNGRSVSVRINDRGPFVRGRSLDLSNRAARKLGIVHAGVVRVKLALPTSVHSEPDIAAVKKDMKANHEVTDADAAEQ